MSRQKEATLWKLSTGVRFFLSSEFPMWYLNLGDNGIGEWYPFVIDISLFLRFKQNHNMLSFIKYWWTKL